MAGSGKVFSGSQAGKVQYPYDAMVYIDGTVVRAIDKEGNTIRRGVAGTDDSAVIQAAIDSVTAGKVYIDSGTYNLAADIYLDDGVAFCGAEGYNTILAGSNVICDTKSEVVISDLLLLNGPRIYVTSSGISENILIKNVIVRGCDNHNFYIGPPDTGTVRNAILENCTAEDGAWGFLIHNYWGTGLMENITLKDCIAKNCGRDIRKSVYDAGFSLENGTTKNIRFINCHAEGCLESGFHQEFSPARENVKYIGCTSYDNGQKTKESRTIVDGDDLTQPTPFICTLIGTTHAETSKVRCRLISPGDTITAFSVRIQGLTAGDVPIDEIITEATPGVTNEVNGWSFYTTATFKALTSPTITVNSVTGALTGDYINVGQDGTYAAGYLASKADYIGCSSSNEVYGFKCYIKASIIGCSDYDSTYPLTRLQTGIQVHGFNRDVAGTKTRNIVTVSANGDYSSLSKALELITDASANNIYTICVDGYIDDTGNIIPKSYVNVIGNNATIYMNRSSTSTGINFINVVNSYWSGLYIICSDYVASAVSISGTTDRTVLIDNCVFEQSPAIGDNRHGIYIGIGASATIKNCTIHGSSGWSSKGIFCENGEMDVYDSYIVGGSAGHGRGIDIAGDGSGLIKNCIIEGGTGTSVTYGGYNIGMVMNTTGNWDIQDTVIKGGYERASNAIYFSMGGAKFKNCTFCNGYGYNDIYACNIIGSASLKFKDCKITYPLISGSFSYVGAGYDIIPIPGSPSFIDYVYVSVTVAGAPGSTLNIGTTDGGGEIAENIPIGTTGATHFAITKRSVLLGSSIYFKPTDTNARYLVYYTCGYNENYCSALYLNTKGDPEFVNTAFESNMASTTCIIYNSTKLYKFINCNFRRADDTKAEVIWFDNLATATNVPIYGCFIGGGCSKLTSFAPNANNTGIGSIIPAIIRPDLTSVLDTMGTPRLLSPFAQITGTSITDYTRLANTLTAQASVATWYGFQGRATYYDFNGTSHYLYRANDTDFDFGNAVTDNAFSVVCCVNPDAVTSRFILGKWDDNVQREWRLFFDASGYPTIQLYDESADTWIGRQDQTAFTTGSWKVLVATYDGSGINAGCKLYIDGVQLDDADYANGAYVAMEAVTANLMVGALKNAAAYSEYYDGKMTWIGIAAKELSADEVWSLTQRLKGVLGV